MPGDDSYPSLSDSTQEATSISSCNQCCTVSNDMERPPATRSQPSTGYHDRGDNPVWAALQSSPGWSHDQRAKAPDVISFRRSHHLRKGPIVVCKRCFDRGHSRDRSLVTNKNYDESGEKDKLKTTPDHSYSGWR